MKIVCDSGATKYSISDDKVRGKVFKIRCKKCSHIIVVRGTHDGAGAGAAPAAGTTPAASDGGGWHLVVNGDQVGPLPDADVRERITRGEVNAETYVWKDGFTDWVKLSTVTEFADDLAANPMATPTSADLGEHFAESNGAPESSGANVLAPASSGNSGGLFGSISVAPASDVDLGGSSGFSAPSPGPDLGGRDLFAAPASTRHSCAENGRGRDLCW